MQPLQRQQLPHHAGGDHHACCCGCCDCRDHSEGSDTWAVNRGWVSVTPLSLRSDVPLRLVRLLGFGLLCVCPGFNDCSMLLYTCGRWDLRCVIGRMQHN